MLALLRSPTQGANHTPRSAPITCGRQTLCRFQIRPGSHAGSFGLTLLSIVVGAAAALVQGLGLVRWPFAVPELARRYVAAPAGPDGDAARRTVEVVFATLHRLLGVAIGEHLGYLFTGLWTLLVAGSILSTAVLPGWLGIIGLPIGIALLIGALEFVGPNERDGWPLAGTIVPIACIAWSLWLIALGAFLMI
jgi:Domain of unknown function (DUF4386)